MTANEWRDIESAPKDGTRILISGHWNSRALAGVGEAHICIGTWTTIMSNGTGHRWFYESWLAGLRETDGIAVTFTHWMPLPPPPVPSGEGMGVPVHDVASPADSDVARKDPGSSGSAL